MTDTEEPGRLAGHDARAIADAIDEVAAALWAVRARKRRALFFKAVDPIVLGVLSLLNLVLAYWITGGPSWWLVLWVLVLFGVQGGVWLGVAWQFGDRMPVDKEILNLVSLRLYDLNRMLKRVAFEGDTHWNVEFRDVPALAEELAALKARVRAAQGVGSSS